MWHCSRARATHRSQSVHIRHCHTVVLEVPARSSGVAGRSPSRTRLQRSAPAGGEGRHHHREIEAILAHEQRAVGGQRQQQRRGQWAVVIAEACHVHGADHQIACGRAGRGGRVGRCQRLFEDLDACLLCAPRGGWWRSAGGVRGNAAACRPEGRRRQPAAGQMRPACRAGTVASAGAAGGN
jgi:hypothetical protein